MTRRGFLKGLLGTILAGLFLALWSFLIEPMFRLRVQKWRISRDDWKGAPLKIAIIADVHMGEPYMSLNRLDRIVTRTNAIGADVIVILGDLHAGHRWITKPVKIKDTAEHLSKLAAPHGVYAIAGNHDWWDDLTAQRDKSGPILAQLALEENGITFLQNDAIYINRNDGPFWLAGLGDQLAFPLGGGRFQGVDDLPATMDQIDEENKPVVLLAHEPDIFPKVPDRVALTLSGHTHGGQIRLFGWSPVVPSRYGNRFAYGHVREGNRDIVISGGLGCSIMPVRFGVTPEITVVTIGADQTYDIQP